MTLADRYQSYKRWCVKHDLPFLPPAEYEKQLARIPEGVVNNMDAILTNNNRKKDRFKYGRHLARQT